MSDEAGRAPTLGFGPFEWDPARAELRKRGVRVRLAGQPLDVLTMLVSHADRVVSRDELRRELWGEDTFVDFEQGLNTAIARLRQALGDSAEHPRFIETVPGRGYRFTAEIHGPRLPGGTPAPVGSTDIDRRTWLAGGLGILLGAAGTWAGLRKPVVTPAPGSPRRFVVSAPPAPDLLPSNGFQDVAVSPDGRQVVYRAGVGGAAGLYTRTLDGDDGRFLPGVDLSNPFFSYDGGDIAYYAFESHSLMRTSASSGPAIRIAESPGFLAGASWAEDDTIVYATRDPALGIRRVAAGGGRPESLTHAGPGEYHMAPAMLPGGRALLFTVMAIDPGDGPPQIALLDLASGATRLLMPGSHPQYAASGHLVYLVDGNLHAVRFDPVRRRVDGTPVVVLEGIETNGGLGQYGLSREGTLLVAMDADTTRRELVWVDRNGREDAFPAAARPYTYPRISPDGRRIALNTRDTNRGRIFLWDNARATATPVVSASEVSLDLYPVWQRDSEHLAYVSGHVPQYELRMLAVGRGGPGEPIGSGFNLRAPYFFLPSGQEIIYAWQGPREGPRAVELWRTSTARDAEPVRLLAGARNADLSPDGRLMAYQADESGRFEVFVRSFPDVDVQYARVSTNGGIQPVWSPRGGELFYVEPGQPAHLMSVQSAIVEGGELHMSRPRQLMQWPYFRAELGRTYDVSRPDGDRFLAIRTTAESVGAPQTPRVEVVLDWFAELEARIPE